MPDDPPGASVAALQGRAPTDPRHRRGPVLVQSEIDAASGFRPATPRRAAETGVRAMLDAAAIPREPLPALALVFERWGAGLSLGLRDLFGQEVEGSLRSLRAVRYGAFIDDLVLPSQAVVFRAEGLDGSGLVAIGPDLARLVLDELLGAARDEVGSRVSVRPFTGIESAILTRFATLALEQAGPAFAGAGFSVTLPFERVESDPRLAAIARPADAAYLAELGLEVDGRAATLQVVLPVAALEPVRGRLRESAAPDLDGQEPWGRHLASEVWRSGTRAEAVLHETRLPLGRVMDLAVGDTLMFEMKASDLVELRCGGVPLARGRIGRLDGRIAVQVVQRLPSRAAGGTP